MKYAFILGHIPILSRAEISEKFVIQRFSADTKTFVVADIPKFDEQKELNTLGGVVKIGRFCTNGDLQEVTEVITQVLLKRRHTDHKTIFAVSWHGEQPSVDAARIGPIVKNLLKAHSVSSRFLAPRGAAVSTVSLMYNKFFSGEQYEFLVIPDQKGYAVFETVAFQDVARYTLLEHILPHKDYTSGILPIRLAQVLLNIGNVAPTHTLLDPFCGSGILLVVAACQGVQRVVGIDTALKAVHETRENLNAVTKKWDIGTSVDILQGDSATLLKTYSRSVDRIVTEPYLGPSRGLAIGSTAVLRELHTLYIRSFEAYTSILAPKGRIVFIFPLFQSVHDFSSVHQSIRSLGFLPVFPYGNPGQELIYQRPGQRVGRYITVWERE